MKGLTTAATTPGVATDRCRRWANVAYWLLMAVGCAVFLLMNFYTTVKEDDLFHSMIGGGSGRPINSLLDVLRSWVEYYRYDARTANLISFTFNGILGKTVFNICNTLVFGLMAHLLSRLATGRNSAMALVMLFTYMVTAMPVPGETLLWATGSFNYMWAFTAALLFIAYLLWHRDARIGWPKALVVLLLSLLAGGINEGTTFGVFGGLVLYFLLHRDRVDRAVVIAMTGYLLGVLLLLTCPGAWDRASSEVAHDAGAMSLLATRCRLLLSQSLHYVTPAAAALCVMVPMAVRRWRGAIWGTPFPWIFVVLMAFAFVVGKNQARLYFPASMAGFILVVMAAHLLARRWWLRLAVVIAGLALCLLHYPHNIRTMQRYQSFFDGVERSITSSPDSQVVLRAQNFTDYSRFVKYFNFDSWNVLIREQTLCYHYGKGNIQFVPDSVYDRYHSGRLLDGAQAQPFQAPGYPDVEAVLAMSGQDYIAVQMRQDTVSHSYQFAQAYKADGTPAALPVSYFPLLYHGHEYLIFPALDDDITRLTFSPYALDDGETISLVLSTSTPIKRREIQ